MSNIASNNEEDFKRLSKSLKLESLPLIKSKKLTSSDIVKTIYSKETGDLLSNIKKMNYMLKQEINAEGNGNMTKSREVDKSTSVKNTIQSDNNLIHINSYRVSRKNDSNNLLYNNNSTIQIFSDSVIKEREENLNLQNSRNNLTNLTNITNLHSKKSSVHLNINSPSEGVTFKEGSSKRFNFKRDKNNSSSFYCRVAKICE